MLSRPSENVRRRADSQSERASSLAPARPIAQAAQVVVADSKSTARNANDCRLLTHENCSRECAPAVGTGTRVMRRGRLRRQASWHMAENECRLSESLLLRSEESKRGTTYLTQGDRRWPTPIYEKSRSWATICRGSAVSPRSLTICETQSTSSPRPNASSSPWTTSRAVTSILPRFASRFPSRTLDSYRRAADFLNFSNVDVVSLQHEFGIYGGPGGGHILAFLRDLRLPAVTTLHTVLPKPDVTLRRAMDQLVELSTRLVVMTERSRSILLAEYRVPENKIDLIVHGIPDRPFADPNFYKDQFGVEGKYVGLTFGLLSPNKGIEHVLQALPAVIREVPNFVYLILGATHPALVRSEGETYRISLERMAKELGIQKHVSFYNRFVELHELTEFIGAADLYITPYLNPAQAVSGTLAYAFGCGQAVISTPYWHAEELLADDRGVLVPFADSAAIGRAIIALLSDDPRRQAMRKRAYQLGREMTWSHVAESYLKSFQDARHSRIHVPKPLAVRTLEEQPLELPRMNLDHLMRMSDSTGILQHACYSIPNNHEGYCTDDNARALVLTVLLEDLGKDSRELHQAASSYAAFLNYAFNPESGRFRNFMSFDRHWMEQDGSDDSLGRAIWALGTCVGRSRRRSFQSWAVQLFERALPACEKTTSPRTWALSLIGIHEYLRRLSGDRLVNQMRDTLTDKLIDLYEHTATDDWPWFEDVASYNNAKLPHALILSGRWSGNERAIANRASIAAVVGRTAAVVAGSISPHRMQWLLSPRRAGRRV